MVVMQLNTDQNFMPQKKSNATPRRKRLKQADRLQSGKQWLANYTGTHPVRSYMKWYGVDLHCAITELQLLGFKLEKDTIEQMLLAKEKMMAARKIKKEQAKLTEVITIENEEDFAYIAGFTSGGCPYGITHKEMSTFNSALTDASGNVVPDAKAQ